MTKVTVHKICIDKLNVQGALNNALKNKGKVGTGTANYKEAYKSNILQGRHMQKAGTNTVKLPYSNQIISIYLNRSHSVPLQAQALSRSLLQKKGKEKKSHTTE